MNNPVNGNTRDSAIIFFNQVENPIEGIRAPITIWTGATTIEINKLIKFFNNIKGTFIVYTNIRINTQMDTSIMNNDAITPYTDKPLIVPESETNAAMKKRKV